MPFAPHGQGNNHPGAGWRTPLILSALLLTTADAGPPHPWSAGLLRDPAAWPHDEHDAHLAATPQGLRVEVPAGRKWAIAAMPDLTLPSNLGRIRVRIGETGGHGRWFIRLHGDLRRPGEPLDLHFARDESQPGERVFELDPRLWSTRDQPLQLQLGVEGEPGGFAVFGNVAFEPAPSRPNRQPRTVFQPGQKDVATVELMPNLPEPFVLTDWRQKARDYDQFVFDFSSKGDFLPLVWLDKSHINSERDTFGLPSYVGSPNQTRGHPNSQEGVTCMGAVLGATLAGVDKSRQEHDFVDMCEAWFNSANALNLVLNRQQGDTGGSFWYEMFTHIVFYGLADRYPGKSRLTDIMRITAARWHQACLDLIPSDGLPDFNHTAFDFRTRKAVDNGRWREPDAAAGMAWLQYAAWRKFGENRYLAAAENSVKSLQNLNANPHYELLLPYGTLVAARLNAELDREYDLDRLLNWCFGVSDTRGGWGVLAGNWGGYDCDGLVGSIDNRGGYAFAMNTYTQAGALVPLARYQPQYARAMGKWMLNLANSARLFYPGALPAGHESCAFWQGDPRHLIAYEGLRYESLGACPCATGDPVAMKWGPKTDLGLYGAGFAGILGAIVRATNDPRILQLDCLATDFFHAPAYPTFLYYNPHACERRIMLDVGGDAVTVYDIAGKRILAHDAQGQTEIRVPPDGAVVAVLVPANATIRREGPKLMANGIVVAARWDQLPEPDGKKTP